MIELQFLGTSSMVPTKDRNHSAVLLVHDKESILFDCGEGTQKQIKIAGADTNRIKKIFITHWHGDHVIGLPGLIQTLSAMNFSNEEKKVIEIYGPKGSARFIDNMFKSFYFDNRLDMRVIEKENGIICDTERYYVEAMPMDHSVPCIGYAFVEKPRRRINTQFTKKLGIPEGPLLGKLQNGESITFKGQKITADEATTLIPGKKFAYIIDTQMCDNAIKLAKDADVLVCEATHHSKIEDKAEEFKHMTAKSAAILASQANVNKLILTHFSQRYTSTEDLEQEAKDIFPETIAAYDFMKLNIK